MSSNPVAQVRFPAELGILITILGLGVSFVCVLSCIVSGRGPDNLLATDSGRHTLVILSSVLMLSLQLPLKAFDTLVGLLDLVSYRGFKFCSGVGKYRKEHD